MAAIALKKYHKTLSKTQVEWVTTQATFLVTLLLNYFYYSANLNRTNRKINPNEKIKKLSSASRAMKGSSVLLFIIGVKNGQKLVF